jgi:alpha-beta hydrolase superfamily lysophospholipase
LVLGLYVIEKRPSWAGLVFSSGLFTIPDTVSPILRGVAGVLSVVAPWLPVQRLDSNAVSRDAATLAAVKADPLQYTGPLHARTGAEIANAVARFEARQAEIALPMLVLHGTADRLTECEGSKTFYERAESTDKTLRLYEGGYHELYNDLDKEQFFSDINAWLVARVT